MRTLIVILIGLCILAVMFWISHWVRKRSVNPFNAPKLFIILWLIFAVIDTLIGVVAGYPLLDELMIHGLIFAVPALIAWILIKRHG